MTLISFVFLMVGEARQQQAAAKPLKTPPIHYFENHCARCHGSFGAFYGDDFGKDLQPKKLHQVVKEMAEGPAGAPLRGESLEAQVAFHRALIRKEPFVAWTGRSKTELWGEVSENSIVQIRFGNLLKTAIVKGSEWRVVLPSNDKGQAVQVIAALNGKRTTLDLQKSAFSHSK